MSTNNTVLPGRSRRERFQLATYDTVISGLYVMWGLALNGFIGDKISESGKAIDVAGNLINQGSHVLAGQALNYIDQLQRGIDIALIGNGATVAFGILAFALSTYNFIRAMRIPSTNMFS